MSLSPCLKGKGFVTRELQLGVTMGSLSLGLRRSPCLLQNFTGYTYLYWNLFEEKQINSQVIQRRRRARETLQEHYCLCFHSTARSSVFKFYQLTSLIFRLHHHLDLSGSKEPVIIQREAFENVSSALVRNSRPLIACWRASFGLNRSLFLRYLAWNFVGQPPAPCDP